jgi:hypothetical protein
MEYFESTTNMIANNKVSQEELGPVSAIRRFTHMNISVSILHMSNSSSDSVCCISAYTRVLLPPHGYGM